MMSNDIQGERYKDFENWCERGEKWNEKVGKYRVKTATFWDPQISIYFIVCCCCRWLVSDCQIYTRNEGYIKNSKLRFLRLMAYQSLWVIKCQN